VSPSASTRCYFHLYGLDRETADYVPGAFPIVKREGSRAGVASDAIRLLLIRVAAEKALPFEIKVPNSETRAALAELEQESGVLRQSPT
jgi:hypothetical protein